MFRKCLDITVAYFFVFTRKFNDSNPIVLIRILAGSAKFNIFEHLLTMTYDVTATGLEPTAT